MLHQSEGIRVNNHEYDNAKRAQAPLKEEAQRADTLILHARDGYF